MLLRPRSAIIVVLATFCASTIPAQAHSLRMSPLPAPGVVTITANPATGAISGKVTRLDGTTAIAGASVKAYQGIEVLQQVRPHSLSPLPVPERPPLQDLLLQLVLSVLP